MSRKKTTTYPRKAKRCEHTREMEPGRFLTMLYLGKAKGKRRYYKRRSRTLEEAQWHDREAESQKTSGNWRERYEAGDPEEETGETPTACSPLSDWSPFYESSPTRQREDPEASTSKERRSYIKQAIDILGDPTLEEVAQQPQGTFKTLRTGYQARGVQHATWKKCLGRMNGLLAYAVREGALDVHPFMTQDADWRAYMFSPLKRTGDADRRSLKRAASDSEGADEDAASERKRQTVRATSLEADQLLYLCELATDPVRLGEIIEREFWWLVRAMAFHALTGLRPQELLAIAERDVECDHAAGRLIVHVHYCVKMDREGEGHETWRAHGETWSLSGRLKTETSRRSITAGRQALEVLTAHLHCPHRITSAPSLFTEGKLPTIPSQYRERMQTHIIPRIDSNPHLTPNGLRHTYATIALSRGVPIQVISRDLGHNKTSTTMDYYLDFLPSYMDSAAAAIQAGLVEAKSRRLRAA